MTDKTPEEVLAEAIDQIGLGTIAAVIGDTALSDGEYARAKNDVHLDDDEFAAAILAAMPDYTIVRKDELEMLWAALAQGLSAGGNFADLLHAQHDIRALLTKEPTDD